MSWLQIVVLAIVQGLSEFLPISSSGHLVQFLPISSSGHLVLVPSIFGWTDQGLAFDVAVHFGSLVAVVVFFRDDILGLLSGTGEIIMRRPANDRTRMVWSLGLGTVPAAVAGLLFAGWIAANLRDPIVVVFTLAGYGILLALVDRFAPRERKFADIRIRDGVLIGMAQALALVPGTSRSGITITAGRMLGIKRQDAARFSFLLSAPVILLATIYELVILITGDHRVFHEVCQCDRFAAICHLQAGVSRRDLLCPYLEKL